MVEKRDLDSNVDGFNTVQLKKPKLEEGNDAAAPKRPALSLEALEKAKKALQLQKELKEKLKNLPQLQKSAAPTASAPTAPVGNPLLAAATAKAAQIAASFGMAVQSPLLPSPATAAAMTAAALAVQPTALAPSGFRAPKLLVDKAGREVDEQGNVIISRPVQVASSLKVNQAHLAGADKKPGLVLAGGIASVVVPGTSTSANPFLSGGAAAAGSSMPAVDPGFDERMVASKKSERRRKATFEFVQEGSFQKQAEMMRLKAKFGDAAVKKNSALLLPKGPIGPAANPNLVPIGGDPNLVPIGVRRDVSPGPMDEDEAGEAGVQAKPSEPAPPDVEWWDRNLMPSGSYEEDVREESVNIKENKISIYVEHPIPIEPPAEAQPPPPQPLKLTKKELKKLRTQKRQAREKEKQDLIRQGLLEAPKPKVKIANLYRVMGEQAVADPTAMEKEARKQMAERQSAHDDRNLARKLTPAEQREKKMKKLFDDTGLETITTVYKLARLDDRQQLHRGKVVLNAKENHMTGVLLISDPFCLVVVEGCQKSTKRYQKLMLRRIDWSMENEDRRGRGGAGGEGDEDAEAEDVEEREPNCCDMVWQGVVKERAFKKFAVEAIPDPIAAKALLESVGIGNYWDVAQSFNRDEAPPIVLD
ncbi:hypothetical protein CEUSTIGMA_g9276.t1 [Chlamydomonas eustigma]|uniref:Uncharacterized protein n=1 Tax=Chlamydomonas eustigma TaxID=1157962 RepID=A0A250XFI5_9CHLO|nr:hypothetical protein CEUSTIGMA_g9276.t1 [Chlamydomonas eustigma]|eukprot:GAX81848.1 hypothetical protein CEUSTIGMA_g9276.t1 [Chlamydomonas eustigma]